MRCYFLDVGQGASHVISLGGGRALVIDTGRSSKVTLQKLDAIGATRIPVLALTHNDSDHAGGAGPIIAAYKSKIGKIYALVDREKDARVWEVINQEIYDGNLQSDVLHRLEADTRSRILYRDRSGAIQLSVVYPNMYENESRIRKGQNPNGTSAVLVLQAHDRRIVFGGDATLDAWKELHERLKAPLCSDVLSVPHHGSAAETSEDDLRRLYSEIIPTKNAVISVGSNNSHNHPDPDTIDALRKSGATVLCTQITTQCYDHIRTLPEGTGFFRRSGTGITCAGTVVAEITETGIVVGTLDERDLTSICKTRLHQAAIDKLERCSTKRPLCRRCEPAK